jgi:hypothetical protein
VEFFAKLLEEKDRKIQLMTKSFEQESKAMKSQKEELELMQSKLEGLTGMCYGKQNF